MDGGRDVASRAGRNAISPDQAEVGQEGPAGKECDQQK